MANGQRADFQGNPMRREWIPAMGRMCRIQGWFTVILFLAVGEGLFAGPVGPERAGRMVQGWLQWDPRPLEANLGGQIAGVQTYADAAGQPVYFIVDLEPTGYVIVPADDEAEPVIAFVEQGRFNPSPTNPLGALVGRDLPNRISATRRMAGIPAPPDSAGQPDFRGKARQRWTQLEGSMGTPVPPEATGNSGLIEPPGASTLSDVRVAPLIQSHWDQTTAGGQTCYNYYTPNHWPVGCVATATSQLIRYHQYPAAYTPPGGAAHSFNWANMPLVPDYSITLAQRQEIGYLCFQVAESVDMEYAADGSAAKLADASASLRQSFKYSQSIYGKNYWSPNSNISGPILTLMINPNLDAGLPTLLAILDAGSQYGHAIVCDGYGYQNATLYHHLNMGWSGDDDAWYALPNIDGYLAEYDTVYGCAYNIYTVGSGEILSGRTVDSMGRPIEGVQVTSNPLVMNSTTNSKGIYALSRLASNRTYTILASKTGWSFVPKSKQTGASVDGQATCGNVWNFLLEGQLSAGTLTLDKTAYTAGETIQIDLLDNDLNSRGTQIVEVQTSSGDRESVTLTEVTAGKGLFRGTIPTIQNPIVPGNGTLEAWQGQTITVTYQDLNHGTGQAAAVTATAIVNDPEVILYETGFETALDGVWSIVDGGKSTATWEMTDTPDGYGQGKVMLVDSDAAGNVDMDEQLILQVDCSVYRTIRLQFDHHFKEYYADPAEIGDVDVSVDEGAWQNLERYQYGSFDGRVVLDLPAAAEGQPNVRIRWHYYNANWDYYWLIDNVQVSGIRVHTPPTVDPLSYFLAKGATQTVALTGTDDGFPVGRMQYWITALPEHGTLSNPDAGEITSTQLPYALPEGKNQVVYMPHPCFLGTDRFSYAADDFDPTAEGGMSEPAEVTLKHPVVMDADFEVGLPAGWTIVDGYSDGNTWTWTQSGDEGLMVVDSDAAGEVFMDESLITPVINCSQYRQVRLVFDHNFLFNSNEIADVDVQVDGGDWQNLARYKDQDEYGIADLDASALAAGHSSVQFRWHYYNAWYDWFWAVFRVSLVAGSGAAAGDFEEDCDVDLANFAQLAAAWQSQTGQPAYDPACDLAEPIGVIDIGDLMVFAETLDDPPALIRFPFSVPHLPNPGIPCYADADGASIHGKIPFPRKEKYEMDHRRNHESSENRNRSCRVDGRMPGDRLHQ